MNSHLLAALVVGVLTGGGCGPAADGPVSSGSDPDSDSSTTTSGSSSSADASDEATSSSSSSSGDTPLNCEGWSPPDDSGWSLQNCGTEPCPEGEECRYDPYQGCDAEPVCVNPTSWGECACADDYGGEACGCPGYEGPMDGNGRALLECNTGMSRWPVQTIDAGMCGLG